MSTETTKDCPFKTDEHGSKSWIHREGDRYHVTGVTTDGRRFKRTFDSFYWARGINLYRGTLWLVRDGRRWIINRVYN